MADKFESTEMTIDWKAIGMKSCDLTPKRIRTLHGKIVKMQKMLSLYKQMCRRALAVFAKGEIKQSDIPLFLVFPKLEESLNSWEYRMVDEDEDYEDVGDGEDEEDEDERAEKAQEGRGKM